MPLFSGLMGAARREGFRPSYWQDPDDMSPSMDGWSPLPAGAGPFSRMPDDQAPGYQRSRRDRRLPVPQMRTDGEDGFGTIVAGSRRDVVPVDQPQRRAASAPMPMPMEAQAARQAKAESNEPERRERFQGGGLEYRTGSDSATQWLRTEFLKKGFPQALDAYVELANGGPQWLSGQLQSDLAGRDAGQLDNQMRVLDNLAKRGSRYAGLVATALAEKTFYEPPESRGRNSVPSETAESFNRRAQAFGIEVGSDGREYPAGYFEEQDARQRSREELDHFLDRAVGEFPGDSGTLRSLGYTIPNALGAPERTKDYWSDAGAALDGLASTGLVRPSAPRIRSEPIPPGEPRPIWNPDGYLRNAKYGHNHQATSLAETVARLIPPETEPGYSPTGKTMFANPQTGVSVDYDYAGDYFTVNNPARGVKYLDQFGKPIPDNVLLIGPKRTTQTGVPKAWRQGLTHFRNSD